MAGIIPLPNTRVSGMLVRQRLLAQLQADQLDLFRLQNQVSSGQRITLPSEDAPAARRAMTLQRLLERKQQLRLNVETGQSFLQSTDVALNDVAGLLGDIRGAALGAAGTTSTEAIRQEAVAEINGAIEELLATANTQFRGRYLFAGAQTNVEPYVYDGSYVKYIGDNTLLKSFSDIGVLFGTNAAGLNVFGGISDEVLGGEPLNPQLVEDTLLSTLRSGRGISPNGAIQVSDGTSTTIVDISRAATVGDVIRLIEASPPAGREITASVNGGGITLQLDAAGGGTLTVTEVGSGKTASELGILETSGVGTAPLVGGGLDPILTKTTRLEDLLGTKARARLVSPGDNNNVLLTANSNGANLDGVTIQIVDDELLEAAPGISQGGEYAVYQATAQQARASLRFSGPDNDLTVTAVAAGAAYNNVDIVVEGATGIGNTPVVSYDAIGKRLTITVDDAGATTIGAVEAEINATGLFTAQHDVSSEGASYNPASFVAATDINLVRGDTGNSGGAAKTLYVHVAANVSTANDVVAAINAEGQFTAQLDTLDTTNTTQAGTQLVDVDATAVTAGGSGENLDLASGIRVVNGGSSYTLSFAGAETVEDLLNVINGSEANLHAEINADATGINLRSRLSGSDFQIGENGGLTATQLGLRSSTEATRLADMNYGVGVPTKAGVNHTVTSADLELTTRDGQVFNVDLSAALTVADAITAINTVTGANLTAQPGAGGTGITLIDNTTGAGTISVTQSGAPLSISGGIPVHAQAVDFTITARDGQSFNINLSSAATIGEAIDLINARTGGVVAAQLATSGNGIELVDNSPGAGNLSVTTASGSQAAEYLGLIPSGSTTVSVAADVITGSDRNFLETPSVFTTLVRLKDALAANDIVAMERAIESIDADIDRVTFARSEVGARQQSLDITEQNLQEEDVQLRSALSEEIEVDIVEAISNLTARQISLEASLRATANILQLSLLNFI
jgi:flagellin-like hook-associated protein FlgL